MQKMAGFQDQHPADVAEYLTDLESKDRNIAFLMLPPDRKTLSFLLLQPQVQIDIIKSLGSKEQADMLNNLPPDNRTKLFENFPDDLIKTSINILNNEEREIALTLLGYEKDSIARLMTPH